MLPLRNGQTVKGAEGGRAALPARRIVVGVMLATGVALGAFFMTYPDFWLAGWPTISVMEGRWVLHEVDGDFPVGPPEWIEFEPATTEHHAHLLVKGRTLRFELRGVGQIVFDDAPDLEPLVSLGEKAVFTTTHLCAPFSEWDQLTLYPDGMPIGRDPNRRSIRYEREGP